MPPFRLAALAVLAAFAASPQADAQGYGALHLAQGQTATFAQARARMPRLDQVIFEKADRNGDGLIDASEAPTLEAVYRAVTEIR
jgi:hypothetical protein